MKLTVAVINHTAKLDKKISENLLFGDELLIISEEPIPLGIKRDGKINVIYHPLDNNFSEQRNFALSKAEGDWVFFVDSDEVVGTNLANEVLDAIKSKAFSGYLIRRIDLCFHRPFLYGETGNTKILRLARKEAGRFHRPVHETWNIKGRVGELVHPLYHLKDNFVSGFLDRMSLYGITDSLQLDFENKPFSFFRLLVYPKAKFVINYFVKLGFLDGMPGLFLAYLMMVQSLSVRVFQWTSQKQSTV